MKFILPVVLLFQFVNAFSQKVTSSCIAPDDIIKLYQSDADRLTITKFKTTNSPYLDSVQIPKAHSDTFLRALLAVYNASALPCRDSIVSLYNIHCFPYINLNDITIVADPNTQWMKNLKDNVTPTGNTYIDNLISKFKLKKVSYSENNPNPPGHLVRFKAEVNCNIEALSTAFKKDINVYSAYASSSVGDGNRIIATIQSDYVQLDYQYRWGDCPAGCIYKHHWIINVYYDCSVELVSNYGDLYNSSNLFFSTIPRLSVYPNPVSNELTVYGLNPLFNYKILDLQGQLLEEGITYNGHISGFNAFSSGLYLLQVFIDDQIFSFRILKE